MGVVATSFAGRHNEGRPRDRMSIAVLLERNPPDRLFSPLEGRIFDSVAQHGTCQKREAVRCDHSVGNNGGFQGVERISPRTAGKRKKIELCAARFFRRVEPALEVGNPDLKSACQQ